MTDRKNCAKRAAQLANENYAKYHNCGQATFSAIMDALREAGITVTTPEVEDLLFKGLSGLSGGHANLGCGNCGAMTGASMVLSLVANIGPALQSGPNKGYRWIAFDNAAKGIAAKFKETFHGLTCKSVTWERYGMQWDFWNPDTNEYFLKEMKDGGCTSGDESTVALAAAWATEAVLEALENPRTIEQVTEEHDLAKVNTVN